MAAQDLTWSLVQFKPDSRRLQAYRQYERYYDGDHDMAFATEKFRTTFGQIFKEFSENSCAAVVDALNDRLEITGFRSTEAEMREEQKESPIPGTPPRKVVKIQDDEGDRAWDIWNRNRMDLKSAEVHEESLKMGDAYVIVWPNERMEPEIYVQNAMNCAVEYEPNSDGVIRRAAKTWYDYVDKRWRLNIYLPDRIEKYTTRREQDKGNTLTFPDSDNRWHLVPGETVLNPYGRVPVFHFPNRRVNKYGRSELQNVVSLQNGLNKADMDMIVAMEFASYKQRYTIGLDVEMDPETGQPIDPLYRNYGVERMMNIPDPEAKVGQFDATDLHQFLRVQDKFWASIARVSGTPLHYFYITEGDFPSGEAMKSAEARFVKRITDRQTAFGNLWEDVILFCRTIEGPAPPEDLGYDTLWIDASPRSEAEIADTAVKKRAIGVPRSALQREMGYSEEEIERNLEEADAEAIARAALNQPQQEPEENGNQPRGQRQAGQNTQGVRR